MKLWNIVTAFAVLVLNISVRADQPNLQPTDLLAICGDSITEQHIYSVDIEDYLLMCKPVPGVRAEQFGWGGETSWGFLGKMPTFMLPFKATAATTCYGMNDGGYGPLKDDVARNYRQSQTAIIENFKKSGIHFIVLGTPGVVDSQTFRGDPAKAVIYNQTLAGLGDIDRDIAQKEGVAFADVHGVMADVMDKAKAKYGKDYIVAGTDGVHPKANGHLVMAYAFLKAMGFDGNIGTITVDLAGNKADASDGHKIVSMQDGQVTVESSRYPFCFNGDPKSPDATTGIIEFFPFNNDLNRFTLIVNNPGADKLKVTWGNTSKEFAAADLAKGINLAAEFLDNPFSKPFAAEEGKILAKQINETKLIKNTYFPLKQLDGNLPESKEQFEKMYQNVESKIDTAATATRDAVQPVTHTIKIEAVK